MNTTRTQGGYLARGGWLAIVFLTWLSMAHLTAADIELATLKSGTDVFTNVTVYGQTATDLFIKHSRGFGNVKVSSLDEATLRLIKSGGKPPEEEIVSVVSSNAAATVATLRAKLESSSPWKIPSEEETAGLISQARANPNVVVAAMVAAVVLYLLFCLSMKLICQNAGSKPGLMIWIPLLQMFPLLRAAKMSAWWFVAFLIPLVGIVAHIVWCLKICKACGKSKLVALLLILPVTNLLAILYLALSRDARPPVEKAAPVARPMMVLGEA